MEEAYFNEPLEKYLSGQLSEEERVEFEKRLDMDTNLQEELNAALKAKAALHAHGLEEQKTELVERWHAQNTQRANQSRKLYMALSAAAAIVLLLLFFFFPSSQPSNQEIFAQHYKRPLASSIRSGKNQSITKANILFNQGKFEEAAGLYVKPEGDMSIRDQEEAAFHAGIAYWELGQEENAKQQFDKLRSPEYLSMGQWFEMLFLLNSNKTAEAKQLLTQITSQKGHPYFENATQILDQIK